MRPFRIHLLRAFFAYFAAISALGPGFHHWPALGCHGHACVAEHGHSHVHAHAHGTAQCHHAHANHKHDGPAWEGPGLAFGHDDCLVCQYYGQTQIPPAAPPKESSGDLSLPVPVAAPALSLTAPLAAYAPRGPPAAA